MLGFVSIEAKLDCISSVYPVSFSCHCSKIIAKGLLKAKDEKILYSMSMGGEVIVELGWGFVVGSSHYLLNV